MLDTTRLYRVLGIVGATACLTISFVYLLPRLAEWDVLPDFTVFWTAARVDLRHASAVYDTAALTAAQSWAVDPSRGPRPFPYPPTALLAFLPFGLMPFWIAYWSWLALSAAAFWSASRKIATGWAVPLSLATPQAMLVLILGQTTLIVGSLVIWSLVLIERRPLLSGALLGIVAGLKPQAVILAPVALASAGHWRVLGVTLLSFCAMFLASLSLGGIEIWSEWFRALGAFPDDIEKHGLDLLGATPWMAARVLGFDVTTLLWVQIGGIVAGIAVVWWAFKSENVCTRVTALVVGGLLASPYAMRYDLATLAPVLTMGLLSGTLRGLVLSVPLFALTSLTILPALVVSLAAQIAKPRKRALPVTIANTGTMQESAVS